MEASGESEEKVLLPTQETAQNRIIRDTAPQGLAARASSQPAEALNGEGAMLGAKPPAGRAALDEARFSAGIVRFYEAVLNEPVPERMLRLVDEIAKREPKR
jgi:hypothetical protein